MTGRALRLASAAGALWLAVASARRWHAEEAYVEGLHATRPGTERSANDDPTEDVPGRLESYREACERDPCQPLYALRAAQIEVARALADPESPERPRLVEAARARLDRVVALQPLDGRGHHALAWLRSGEGDDEGALESGRRALLTARRNPRILDDVASVAVRAWRRTGDPDALALALDAARLGDELVEGRDPSNPPLRWVPGTRALTAALRSPSGPTVDDLRLAARGRSGLLEAAARRLEEIRAEDLEASRREPGERR